MVADFPFTTEELLWATLGPSLWEKQPHCIREIRGMLFIIMILFSRRT